MRTKKIKQTENEVKKAIKEYLEIQGYKVFRINNAGIFRGKNSKGKARFSFAGDAGVADLYAVKPGCLNIWIETKATGKLPSEAQMAFGKCIENSGNCYWLWADSLNMFVSYYERYIKIKEQFKG